MQGSRPREQKSVLYTAAKTEKEKNQINWKIILFIYSDNFFRSIGTVCIMYMPDNIYFQKCKQ